MRVILLAGMMSMAATYAQAASSIDVVSSDSTARSIERVACPDCKPPKAKKAATPDIVLKPGTQKVELREVNGELKVFRTEAWLGGSPVTYVSKASTEQIDKRSAENAPTDTQKDAPVVIDTHTTTSAVNADLSGDSVPAEQPKQVQNFDPQSLQLRLN
jgi:hypothetical protein